MPKKAMRKRPPLRMTARVASKRVMPIHTDYEKALVRLNRTAASSLCSPSKTYRLFAHGKGLAKVLHLTPERNCSVLNPKERIDPSLKNTTDTFAGWGFEGWAEADKLFQILVTFADVDVYLLEVL